MTIPEKIFWRLVRDLESVSDAPVKLPMLRAFVQLGRQEERLLLEKEKMGLHDKITELKKKISSLKHENKLLLIEIEHRTPKIENLKIIKLQDAGREFERNKILELLNAGLPTKEIAKLLKVSVATLYRRVPTLRTHSPRFKNRGKNGCFQKIENYAKVCSV